MSYALVTSKIDYCNSLLYGCNKDIVNKLQICQNVAARLVLQIGKYEPISEKMVNQLHWLPVQKRIVFKIAITVRNCLTKSAPIYLCNLCTMSNKLHDRELRSALVPTLYVPRYRLEGMGGRGFFVSGPEIWNNLPFEIKRNFEDKNLFKKGLKTYLMRK